MVIYPTTLGAPLWVASRGYQEQSFILGTGIYEDLAGVVRAWELINYFFRRSAQSKRRVDRNAFACSGGVKKKYFSFLFTVDDSLSPCFYNTCVCNREKHTYCVCSCIHHVLFTVHGVSILSRSVQAKGLGHVQGHTHTRDTCTSQASQTRCVTAAPWT